MLVNNVQNHDILCLKANGYFQYLVSILFFLKKYFVFGLYLTLIDRHLLFLTNVHQGFFFSSSFLWTHSTLSKEGMQKSFQLFQLTDSSVFFAYVTKPGTALEKEGCYWTPSCHDNSRRRVAAFNHTKRVNITLNKGDLRQIKPCPVTSLKD